MLHRRARFVWIVAAAAVASAVACGDAGNAADAGGDVVYGHHSLDASGYEAEAAPKTPLD